MGEELFGLLELAKHAASLAAAVHQDAIEKGDFQLQTKASAADLVTEIDCEAEQKLVAVIRLARPNDEIIGEEGTHFSGTTRVRWFLDPLDGTTNFVHRYPAHSVAVGVEIDGCRTIGVVHDTFSHRVYSGVVGYGATCNGEPLTVRKESELLHALVGTGFLPIADVRRLQADLLREILPRVRDIRRSGCPSLDICGVAAGRLDAFYECGLGQWDITAAAAIAEAAGATVLLLHSDVLPDPLLVVANAELATALASALAAAGVTQATKPT